MERPGPIGVFDSGFGGLTILKSFVRFLPDHDFLYLGDNARTPYGNRSFQNVYDLTLRGVRYLFDQGCHLVILACNTASAKALRNIQQRDLPGIDPDRRVLGVIRPTVEEIGRIANHQHIGLVATTGTVSSGSYEIEVRKFYPEIKLTQEACPMWVPLVENGEVDNAGAKFFVKRHIEALLERTPRMDCLILACTHFPVLTPIIEDHLPDSVRIIEQGEIVAKSLLDYLTRHPEINKYCSRGAITDFLTTDDPSLFDKKAYDLFGLEVNAGFVEV